jgi:hypothetical protein
MGWRLALAARDAEEAGQIGDLSDRARLALAHVCWKAHDQPSDMQAAAEYFEGSAVLGRYLCGLGLSEIGYQRAGDRALGELEAAGLIAKISGRGKGRKTRWRVVVGDRWAPAKAVDNYYDGTLI